MYTFITLRAPSLFDKQTVDLWEVEVVKTSEHLEVHRQSIVWSSSMACCVALVIETGTLHVKWPLINGKVAALY